MFAFTFFMLRSFLYLSPTPPEQLPSSLCPHMPSGYPAIFATPKPFLALSPTDPLLLPL